MTTLIKPRLLGLAGLSGSGKTTLLCDLIGCFKRYGHSVSTIKHAHHQFDVDQPGKDSYRHRESGASEVMVASHARFALMHENRDEPEPELHTLLRHMSAVDWILVEGFKRENFPKILVHRSTFQQKLSVEDIKPFTGLIAIASDSPENIASEIALPILQLGEPEELMNFIINSVE